MLNDADVYVTTPGRMAELMIEWKRIGVSHFIVQVAAPLDEETAARIATDVRPLVASA